MSSLVTIKTFDHPTNAHIANGKLVAAGVPTHLQNIHHASASWLVSNALGGIQLQVPESYASEALALLADEEPLSSQLPNCAKCGGADFSRPSFRWRLSFFLLHVFYIPWRWGDAQMVCDECGFTQNEDVAT